MFVALATVKLKCFICDNAVQFRSERMGAREITRVISTGQNRTDRADFIHGFHKLSVLWGRGALGERHKTCNSKLQGRLGHYPSLEFRS